MKLEKFGKKKTCQLHFKSHTRKKGEHTRSLNIVSRNKIDSIQISCVVLCQFQS